MSTQKAKRIPDEDWQTQKQTLELLWLKENKKLVGQDSVKEIMESRYAFFASKSQYEAQFKQWKWSKNQKNDDWEKLAAVLHQRQRQKKMSNVFIHGALQSPGRVQKRIAPHALSIPKQLSSVLDLRLPQHIAILTPTLDKTEWWTSCLPFDAIEDLLRVGTTRFDNQIPTSPNHSGRSQIMNAGLTVRDGLGTIDRNHHSLVDASGMQERDESVGTGTIVDTTSELDTSDILDFTALTSVLPKSMASTRDFASAHYRQVLFSLANNFVGLEAADMKKVIRFLQKGTSQGLFQLICSGSSYSARAIAQNIFKGAIEMGDGRLIDQLLGRESSGIDVNRLWCCIENVKYTPIERGSFLRHEQVIKVLLKHGADVRKTHPYSNRLHGALECAVRINYGLHDEYTRVNPRIFQSLPNAGGDVSESTLKRLIKRGDGEFFGLLMSAKAHKNVAEWSKTGIFRDAVLSLDDRTAIDIIRTMLDIQADLNFHVARSTGSDDSPCRVIDAAARRGHVEAIQILCGFGVFITNETFLFAIMSGNLTLMRLLLDRGAKVNSHHVLGSNIMTTPLAEAIRLRSLEAIGLLEGYGAIRLDDRNQFLAAIVAASEVENIPFIERLVRLGGQARENELAYALTPLIKEGRIEVATMLIKAGANVNMTAEIDQASTPLVEALIRRDPALVHLLLEADARPNEYGFTETWRRAVEWGDHSIIETLIHAGAVINHSAEKIPNAPLIYAVELQNHTLVKLLLDAGADVNRYKDVWDCEHDSALDVALENEDIDMASYLLGRGADPLDTMALGKAMVENPEFSDLVLEKHRIRYSVIQTGFGCHALMRAIVVGDEHSIRKMLAIGMDANSLTYELGFKPITPFGYAIANSTVEVIELFWLKGCNPNSTVAETSHWYEESYRSTGFLAAVETRSVSKIKLLHQYGGDVNSPAHTRVKYTPLQKAAAVGDTEVVELLIKFGAEVNAPAARSGGGTALQLAAIGGYIPVACLLLNFKADVNAPASKLDGTIALEGAAEHGRLDMLQLLLNAGAGNGGKDQGQFERAIALAKEQGYSYITDLLETYLQQDGQGDEPRMLADGIDDDLGIWHPDQRLEGIGLAPTDWWT